MAPRFTARGASTPSRAQLSRRRQAARANHKPERENRAQEKVSHAASHVGYGKPGWHACSAPRPWAVDRCGEADRIQLFTKICLNRSAAALSYGQRMRGGARCAMRRVIRTRYRAVPWTDQGSTENDVTQDVLDKFFFDSSSYLGLQPPSAAGAHCPDFQAVSPGTLPLRPLPEPASSTPRCGYSGCCGPSPA